MNYSGTRSLSEWTELRYALLLQLLLAIDYDNTLKPIADLAQVERVGNFFVKIIFATQEWSKHFRKFLGCKKYPRIHENKNQSVSYNFVTIMRQ